MIDFKYLLKQSQNQHIHTYTHINLYLHNNSNLKMVSFDDCEEKYREKYSRFIERDKEKQNYVQKS